MNIYASLNEMIEYIEENLENKIEYSKLAQIVNINETMLPNFFSMLCDISLSDYIRKRRLSKAGMDLVKGKEKIIDIAVKYQYDNATSFSRAFEKFYGVKPSQIKKQQTGLKVFSKLHFDVKEEKDENIEYSIISRPKMILYGKKKKTSIQDIKTDAPAFCKEIGEKYGLYDYGMTEYANRFEEDKCYFWVLFENEIKGLEKYEIPESKWICIRINSLNAKDIQKAIRNFYANFLPSCEYTVRRLPELEYYHDKVTDFLVPIQL